MTIRDVIPAKAKTVVSRHRRTLLGYFETVFEHEGIYFLMSDDSYEIKAITAVPNKEALAKLGYDEL